MMTTGEMHETSRAIGKLEEAVRSLSEQWRQQEVETTSGRHTLHEKIDQVRGDVNGLSIRVGGLELKVNEMRPVVRAGEIAQIRSAGARAALRMLWISLVGLGGALLQALTDVFPHR